MNRHEKSSSANLPGGAGRLPADFAPAQDASEGRLLHELQAYRLDLETQKLKLDESRRHLEEASSLTSRIIENAAEGILITDERCIIRSVNPAFEKSTGYTAGEAIGKTPALLKSGHHGKDFYREMWDALNKNGQWQGEVWNRHKSGEIYPEWLSISAVKNSQQKVINYVGIFSDAHTQEYILERLHYLAYYDGLTGLPNRRLFLDRLNVSLSQARRDRHMLAVMFVDLDQFKQINDTLGHEIGRNA
jgi:PAS domain S-box-containing protein